MTTTQPVYLWVITPTGVAGVAPDLAEAVAVLHCAMDQHADAEAYAVFQATTMLDWPYVRLIPMPRERAPSTR